MQVVGMRRRSLCCSLRSALGLGSWRCKSAPEVGSWMGFIHFGGFALRGSFPGCTFALKSGLTSLTLTYVCIPAPFVLGCRVLISNWVVPCAVSCSQHFAVR